MYLSNLLTASLDEFNGAAVFNRMAESGIVEEL